MLRSMERSKSLEASDVLLGAEMPAVLRVATELYAQDRAQVERAEQRQDLKQAAAEAGLPPEYLERAAITLQTQGVVRLQQRRRRWQGGIAALGITIAYGTGWGLAHFPATPTTKTVVTSAHPLAGQDLRGADFSLQNLAGRDLSMACLRGAVFRGTNLRGANLNGADVRGANLIGADLAG